MKNKKNVIILSLLFVSIFCFIQCGDSLKSRLTNRLNNFREALPDNIRTKFDNEDYQQAGIMLESKLSEIKKCVNFFNTEEKKRQFIRGDYTGLDDDIKKNRINKDLLKFNKNFYKIINYECIPTFTGEQTVDFFKVYFKEKLDSMK